MQLDKMLFDLMRFHLPTKSLVGSRNFSLILEPSGFVLEIVCCLMRQSGLKATGFEPVGDVDRFHFWVEQAYDFTQIDAHDPLGFLFAVPGLPAQQRFPVVFLKNRLQCWFVDRSDFLNIAVKGGIQLDCHPLK